MNRTLTSLDIGVNPHSQRAQFYHCVYLAWKHPRRRIEVTFQESRPRFSTTNTALRAVKEAEEHDESHVDFTRHCGKPPLTASASSPLRLSCLEAPTPPDRGDISGQSTPLFHHKHGLASGKRD